MILLRATLVLVVLTCFHLNSRAQGSGEKCLWISDFDSPITLDSLTVFPQSIRIDKPEGIQIDFSLDLSQNQITVSRIPGIDSIRVCFKTLPYDLHSPKANRTLDIYDSAASFKDIPLYTEQLDVIQREEIFKTDNITKTGSITRGISFGNRQDVFVNSNLNLQMEGQLTENVNLRAVITDTNIPFQPEGNTQQIQDFDNINVELYNDNFSLLAGDVVLKKRDSDFLRFYKNVQGFQFNTKYKLPNGFNAETTMAGSVAKGRFNSTLVEAIEGVLGPYRLRGPNNERFIIVIAGSERVFLDGKQLVRGFNNDYVIDYNLGEITFTNRVLITKFSRIRVDFEFSDQNYSRSIFRASHYQSNETLELAFDYYSEKDNRNRPLLADLSQEDMIALARAGDDLNNAFTTRADSVSFNPDLVLYRKTVGMDNIGGFHDIFQYSTNPDSAFFRVQFTEVGVGNGNYILLNSTVNGRIYEWIAPVNGVPQGNYEPISLLNAPNQKSMFTIGGGLKLNEHDEIRVETAFSKNDLNLFSDLDSEDDNGLAYKARFNSANRQVSFAKDYVFNAGLSYEYNSAEFSFIDRVRYIEFDRDWSFNRTEFTENFSENIINLNFGLKKDERNTLDYRLVSRKRGEAVNGFQHYLTLNKELGNLNIASDLFAMNNDQTNVTSGWTRLNLDLSLNWSWIVPGYRYSLDRNEVRNDLDNSVIRTAMNFSEHNFYLRSNPAKNSIFGLEYQLREDRLPINGVLVNNNRSETWNANYKTRIDDTQDINMVFIYRNLENLMVEGEGRNDETIMGRLDWNGRFWKNSIRSELTYSLANSRELRREFIFIQVPTGEGTHTWRDDNGDGVQDLNEFYIAINPDEKNYAKIFVPTDTYEEAFNTNISYRLNVRFPNEWGNAGGLKKFLSQVSNNTSWTLDSKITDDDLSNRLWPVGGRVAEEEILASRELFRSTIFFNRSAAAFGADIGINNAENKQLLSNGFQQNRNRDIRLHTRWNFQRRFNFDLTYIESRRVSTSDFLTSRNYLINGVTYQPSMAWQPNSYFRLTTTYSRKEKSNDFEAISNEQAKINELSLDLRFTRAAKSSINASFNFIDIEFTGDENSPIGYELLEALRPGSNYTWNMNWQQKLGSGLQLTLRYDGRKSGSNRTIHVGRVQVSALF